MNRKQFVQLSRARKIDYLSSIRSQVRGHDEMIGELTPDTLPETSPDMPEGTPDDMSAISTSASVNIANPTRPHDEPQQFVASDLQRAYLFGRRSALASACPQSGYSYIYQEFALIDPDIARLEAAWNTLIARHDMLRAHMDQSGAIVVRQSVPRYRVAVADARGASSPELESSGPEGFANWSADSWPLFRLQLVADSARPAAGEAEGQEQKHAHGEMGDAGRRRYRLKIAVDLIIADARSIWALYGELDSLYSGGTEEASADRRHPPEQGTLTMGAYDAALQQYRRGADVAAAKQYWRRKLCEIAPAPALPQVRERGSSKPAPSPRHRRFSARIHSWSVLKAKAAEAGIPANVVLLWAYADVLRIWSQQAACTVVFVNWRRLPVHPAIERGIGDFTTLCWYEHRAERGTFRERLQRAHEQVEADIAHGVVSGISALRRRRLGRGQQDDGTFPVVMTDMLTSGHEGDSASFAVGQGLTHTAQVALDCVPVDRGDTLDIHWDVDIGRIDEDSAAQHFTRYVDLLVEFARSGLNQENNVMHQLRDRHADRRGANAMSEQRSNSEMSPEERHQVIDGMSPEVRHQVINGWNDTRASYERHMCMHQLFEAQVAVRPDHIATSIGVGSESTAPTMSYGELNRRANRLARHLVRRGIQVGQLVGICLPRSHDMIVTLMAILKAGGAYVPLDAREAKGRIGPVVDKAGLTAVVTNRRHREHIDGKVDTVISIDDDAHLIAPEDAHNLDRPGIHSDRRAYVIFTSGSTGTPKGVVVRHRPVINLIEWVGKTTHLGVGDTVLFTTSLGFDLSVFDIFGMLALGGTIRIVGDEQRKNVEYLAETLCTEDITFWDSAPAALNLLMPFLDRRGGSIANDKLRLVFLSGDWIPLTLPDHVRRHFPTTKVMSLGGATEATVWSNYFWVGAIEPSWRSIPYGRPIQNARYYILNDDGQPCPIGVEGDLYIGGECLSDGYLNDAELTANAFVPDPFWSNGDGDGAIMYKTGDRARFFADGNIEFLGRRDFQVKVRGYRIELGEIEHRLGTHDEITAAVVMVREDTPGDQKLVAYVIPRAGWLPTSKEMRGYVRQELPDYMVPNMIIPIESMPVTANGKLDRKALPWPPPPRQLPTEPPAAVVAGRAAVVVSDVVSEIASDVASGVGPEVGPGVAAAPVPAFALADIADILTTFLSPHVAGATLRDDDDLFDLGVTSLTIAQLVQEVGERFGVQLAAETVFEDPSVAAIARAIHDQLGGGGASGSGLSASDLAELTDLDSLGFVGGNTPIAASESAEPITGSQVAATSVPSTGAVSIVTVSEARQPTPLAHVAKLLARLRQRRLGTRDKYLYPSAGGLYPIQVYLAVKPGGVSGLSEGIYYYHPIHNRLYCVAHTYVGGAAIHHPRNRAAYEGANYALYFIGETAASEPVYGDLAHSLVMLDSGYVAQLLLSSQEACGVELTPAIAVDFGQIRHAFSLQASHTFALCLLGTSQPTTDGRGADMLSRDTWPVGDMSAHHRNPVIGREPARGLEALEFLSVEAQEALKRQRRNLRDVAENGGAIELDSYDGGDGNGAAIAAEKLLYRSCQRRYLTASVPQHRMHGFLALVQQSMRLLSPSQWPASHHSPEDACGVTELLEVYLVVRDGAVAGMAGGSYRYHPDLGQLSMVSKHGWAQVKACHLPFNRRFYGDAGFTILLVADMDDVASRYGHSAVDLVHLQAGMVGQALMDNQGDHTMGVCPIGGMIRAERIVDAILPGSNKTIVHSFTGGHVDYAALKKKAASWLHLGQKSAPSSSLSPQPVAPAEPTVPAQPHPHSELPETRRQDQDVPLAVIGMGCRFPGADSADEYWQNLVRGQENVIPLPKERRRQWQLADTEGHGDGDGDGDGDEGAVRGGFLRDIAGFDHRLFQVSPLEARTMDPQERLFLEVAWACLEDAGYTPEAISASRHRVGVFVGAMWSDYQGHGVVGHRGDDVMPTSFHSAIANRVSHFFDFKGPSIALDTSCASGITAIHLARASIARGECDMALVGAVNLVSHRHHYQMLKHLDLLAGDAHCRSFAADADGWIVGEGGAAVLLRAQDMAEQNGDVIHALITGSAVGHTGRTRRYAMPSAKELGCGIKSLLDQQGVPAESISYVECAAPGASLTDAAELSALAEVFSARALSQPPCALGSVKPNIGHLESASALSQLIKVVLQMRHRTIAPTRFSGRLNPMANVDARRLYVNRDAAPWHASGSCGASQAPRRALINAVGYSGSHGHLLVEEPKAVRTEAHAGAPMAPVLVPVSAHSDAQLHQALVRLEHYLGSEAGDAVCLSALAYTLQVGRVAMSHRFAAVARDGAELRHMIRGYLNRVGDRIGHGGDATVIGDQAGAISAGTVEHTAAGTGAPADPDSGGCLATMAQQWVIGAVTLAPSIVRTRLSLPTYPFARPAHWIHSTDATRATTASERVLAEPPHTTQADHHGERRVVRQTIEQVQVRGSQQMRVAQDPPSPQPAAGLSLQNHRNLVRVERYMCGVFAEAAEMAAEEVRGDRPLEDYGISSLIIVRMNQRLESEIGAVSKTLFFEHRCLSDVSAALLARHGRRLQALLGLSEDRNAEGVSIEHQSVEHRNGTLPRVSSSEAVSHNSDGDMAIIGLAGRYPQADNLDQFWDNLCRGVDSIGEIPRDRWDYRDNYSNGVRERGKNYCKWGAFLDHVDRFDPLFFGISPREAATLDPQSRLFLELSWELFENAGYSLELLQQTYDGGIGVFVGVMYGEYEFYGIESAMNDQPVSLSASHSTVANRVSYFYDFHGPSMAIDTMCSSSLVALHQAIASIRQGDCSAAVVGGINLSIHPYKYLTISHLGMASPTGRCRAFSKHADGFVPGEGAGAVLIKPLAQAQRDGDNVLAVIKGSAVNHGGKTNGYTVPNPALQAKLVASALQRSGVHPATISYVEAHGTGTSLGDPIEISGLSKAYAAHTEETQFCAIGTLKSNIGHLEAAAGIAGLTKIVLQLQHKKLVPSLHAAELNPHIPFADSPFYVQRELSDWSLPATDWHGADAQPLRRAAISGFGAGGTNAHVIIEEYPVGVEVDAEHATEAVVEIADRGRGTDQHGHQRPEVVLISARTSAQLQAYARSMEAYVKAALASDERANHPSPRLADIAYTTQVGRTAMAERVALVVSSLAELADKLGHVAGGDGRGEGVYASAGGDNRGDERGRYDFLLDGPEGHALLNVLLESGSLDKLAHVWTTGVAVPWASLPRASRPRRVGLPTYPFAGDAYWLEQAGVRRHSKAGAVNAAQVRSDEDAANVSVIGSAQEDALIAVRSQWLPAALPAALPVAPVDETPTAAADRGGVYVVFAEDGWLYTDIASALPEECAILVTPGPAFAEDHNRYTVNPEQFDDYVRLFDALAQRELTIASLVYAWSPALVAAELSEQLASGAYALTAILQAGLRTPKRVDWLLQCIYALDDAGDAHAAQATTAVAISALTGLLKSAAAEHGGLSSRVIGVEDAVFAGRDPDGRAALIAELMAAKQAAGGGRASAAPSHLEVRYQSGERLLRQYQLDGDCLAHDHGDAAWVRNGGVYLITGGCGAIGMHMARHMARQGAGTLILVGRRPHNPTIDGKLAELRALGATAVYESADIAEKDAVAQLVARIADTHGALHGVIHAAGTIRDSLLVNKRKDEMAAVIAAKVLGLTWLDRALAQEPLDVFVACSSLVAIMGNPGQSDYGFANAYVDHFMERRAELEAAGRRHGRSISLGWPYWDDGGMELDERELASLKRRTGLTPLTTEPALRALDGALTGAAGAIAWAHGSAAKLKDHLRQHIVICEEETTTSAPARSKAAGSSSDTAIPAASAPRPAVAERMTDPASVIAAAIVDYVVQETGVRAEDVGDQVPFTDLGMSSLMVASMIDRIDARFGIRLYVNEVQVYNTLSALTAHLLGELGDAACALDPAPSPSAQTESGETNEVAGTDDADNAADLTVEQELAQYVADITGIQVDELACDVDFPNYGMSSLMLVELIDKVDGRWGLRLYPNELNVYGNIDKLADYLRRELDGAPSDAPKDAPNGAPSDQTDEAAPTDTVARSAADATTSPLSLPPAASAALVTGEVKPMVFVLSTPRAGSTLLRVMLMGHSQLFAPPELHLLQFNSLKQRQEILRRSNQEFLREGLVESLKELLDLDAGRASELMSHLEARDLSIWQTYEYLRVLCQGRYLVDKSPTYGTQLDTLLKAEEIDHNARYIFLCRHPLAMINSFVKNRFDKMLGLSGDPWQLGEQMWTDINGNIIDFFARIPDDRKVYVRYEDMVTQPEVAMRSVCDMLGVGYEAAMIEPYSGDRMTTGLHEQSMSIGDPRFLTHTAIDAKVAEAYKQQAAVSAG